MTDKNCMEYKWKISRTAWLDDAYVYADSEEKAKDIAIKELKIDPKTIVSIHKIVC